MKRTHPVQKVYVDSEGTVRFQDNKIVRFLLENSKYDLNALRTMPFDKHDWDQFGQLIGYSLSGSPSYIFEESVEKGYQRYYRHLKKVRNEGTCQHDEFFYTAKVFKKKYNLATCIHCLKPIRDKKHAAYQPEISHVTDGIVKK